MHFKMDAGEFEGLLYNKISEEYFKNYTISYYASQHFGILKSDTSSGGMNEKVDHWLDSFENVHKKYIIMPPESLNYSFLEESLFITV